MQFFHGQALNAFSGVSDMRKQVFPSAFIGVGPTTLKWLFSVNVGGNFREAEWFHGELNVVQSFPNDVGIVCNCCGGS